MERIQIVSVLDVSMVDLYAEDAYLVIAIPNELKQAIDKMLKNVCTIKIVLSFIWVKPNAEFSKNP